MTDWTHKVILITGASSGLGLELARAWAKVGADVILVARNEARLSTAADEIRKISAGGSVLPIAVDITDQAQVDRLFERVRQECGRLDVLVNNAGISARGRILETPPEEFERLFELNLLAVVRCVRAAAPLLIKSQGEIVNIGSLGGKSASRFLGAYPTSKFALAGYSQQLRLELVTDGVNVLLVSPGPIAREDAGIRYDRQVMDSLPDSARRPGGGVKLDLIDPGDLTRRIIRACERRQSELVVPGKARLLFAIQQLWPALGDWIIRKMTRAD